MGKSFYKHPLYELGAKDSKIGTIALCCLCGLGTGKWATCKNKAWTAVEKRDDAHYYAFKRDLGKELNPTYDAAVEQYGSVVVEASFNAAIETDPTNIVLVPLFGQPMQTRSAADLAAFNATLKGEVAHLLQAQGVAKAQFEEEMARMQWMVDTLEAKVRTRSKTRKEMAERVHEDKAKFDSYIEELLEEVQAREAKLVKLRSIATRRNARRKDGGGDKSGIQASFKSLLAAALLKEKAAACNPELLALQHTAMVRSKARPDDPNKERKVLVKKLGYVRYMQAALVTLQDMPADEAQKLSRAELLVRALAISGLWLDA
eukprot:gene22742-29907_t